VPVEEELLDVDDIQGNILGGFNKDFQVFLFLQIASSVTALAATRTWLGQMVPAVNSVGEVASFNKLFKGMRRRQGADPVGLASTWMNIAFSASALRRLTTVAEVDEFSDESFREGLSARSGGLGDPTDTAAQGNCHNWVVGGPDNEADIVVIIASDLADLLDARTASLKSSLPTELRILWEQQGETLAPPLTGHEHFGFKDGVSQPGVRGLLQATPKVFLTPRVIDAAISPQPDSRQPEFAAPGQPLIWPGQFVFGYRRQSPSDPRTPPAPPLEFANGCPSWGRNGSYLVIRRLRQDVPAFRTFMRTTAQALGQKAGFAGLTTTHFASMCVGRWPSGAPIMRSPDTDNSTLADDPNANNFFQYVNDSPSPPVLHSELKYPGDKFILSRRDDKGITCPFSSHVRKVNPRDTITEQGSSVDTLTRLILRRGIPFGAAYPGGLEDDGNATAADARVERGLMFVSYQTSIEEQFAFLQNNWANDLSNPNGSGGHDPIIGQGDRSTGGARSFSVRAAGQAPEKQTLLADFVTPTGGGYFFSPSISTIAHVLGVAN
jgi:Dyp-type peroxidase family